MGLFTAVLGAPLAPVRGVIWLAERIEDEAARQLSGPDMVRAELAELARALERGHIDEATYDSEEERLLRLLPPLGSVTPSAPAGPALAAGPTAKDGKWRT